MDSIWDEKWMHVGYQVKVSSKQLDIWVWSSEEFWSREVILWLFSIKLLFKVSSVALTRVAQLIGHCPTKRKVASLIPGQDTCPCCEFSPWFIQDAADWCFSHQCSSLPTPPLALARSLSLALLLALSLPSPILSKNNKSDFLKC